MFIAFGIFNGCKCVQMVGGLGGNRCKKLATLGSSKKWKLNVHANFAFTNRLFCDIPTVSCYAKDLGTQQLTAV